MAIKSTTRTGMAHLSHPDYAMDPREFMKIVDWIESQAEQKIDITNARFSEKADGVGIRFGLDEMNRFFLESSRSGPQFEKGAFSKFAIGKTGKPNQISKAFDDMLDKLDDSKVTNILKKYNTNGIKVIGEAFYLPNAIKHDTDDDLVKFIATYYRRSKLGDWATVVLFDVINSEGVSHKDSDKIIKELKSISDKNLIFDDPSINVEQSVSFANEIKELKKLIAKLEDEQKGKMQDILSDTSKKRTDVEKRKMIKQEVGKFQKTFSDKLSKLIKSGKFGPEYEGLVIKLANGVMFKITSDTFRANKSSFKAHFKRLKGESKNITFKEYLTTDSFNRGKL